MKPREIIPHPIYRIWRRAWGEDWLDQEMRLLRAKRIPWRLKCHVVGHDWGEKKPVVDLGPLQAPPRERSYRVLAFHSQCARCYDIKKVPGTVHEKLAAIEDAIREDLDEWPVIKTVFQRERDA